MITAIEPNVPDTGRYCVNEAAEILGIHPNTVLRMAKLGYLKFGIRKSNGRKFFTGSDIKKYWKAQL